MVKFRIQMSTPWNYSVNLFEFFKIFPLLLLFGITSLLVGCGKKGELEPPAPTPFPRPYPKINTSQVGTDSPKVSQHEIK